jgi:hypothetical protein
MTRLPHAACVVHLPRPHPCRHLVGAWYPAELARRLAAEGPYPSEADELRELAGLVRALAAEEGSTWAAGLSSTLAEAGGLAAARLYGAFGRRYLPFMAQLSTLDDDNLGVRGASGWRHPHVQLL